jgi:hypothetical protein
MGCRAAQPGWSVSIARVKKLLTECTQVMVTVAIVVVYVEYALRQFCLACSCFDVAGVRGSSASDGCVCVLRFFSALCIGLHLMPLPPSLHYSLVLAYDRFQELKVMAAAQQARTEGQDRCRVKAWCTY